MQQLMHENPRQALRVVSDVVAQRDNVAPFNGADVGGWPREFLSRVVPQFGVAARQSECRNGRDHCRNVHVA